MLSILILIKNYIANKNIPEVYLENEYYYVLHDVAHYLLIVLLCPRWFHEFLKILEKRTETV